MTKPEENLIAAVLAWDDAGRPGNNTSQAVMALDVAIRRYNESLVTEEAKQEYRLALREYFKGLGRLRAAPKLPQSVAGPMYTEEENDFERAVRAVAEAKP